MPQRDFVSFMVADVLALSGLWCAVVVTLLVKIGPWSVNVLLTSFRL